MLALKSFSTLIFALSLVTAAPCSQHNCSSEHIVELAKLGKDLVGHYINGSNRSIGKKKDCTGRELATGITVNETRYYTAEVPGLPNCTSHGCHNICNTFPFFEGVFEDFNSSLSDDIMNPGHKTFLVTIINKILEIQHHCYESQACLPRLPRPSPNTLERKMMFYNAFRKYQNYAEKAQKSH